MKKIAGSLIAMFFLLAVLSTPLVADGSEPPPVPPDGSFYVDLMAGQHTDAGDVYVWTFGGNLYVQFMATDGWSLGETHLYVGSQLPTKTAPGQFPYKGETTYAIPLSDLPEGTLYIAAHAVVQRGTQQETAWGAGSAFGKNWAMYFTYEPCDDVAES